MTDVVAQVEFIVFLIRHLEFFDESWKKSLKEADLVDFSSR